MTRKFNNYIILDNEFREKEDLQKALDAFNKAYDFALTNKEKIDSLYEIADINLIFKNYDAAYKNYSDIIELKNDEAGAYYGLGVVSDFLNLSLTKQRDFYLKAIELDDSYDRAYYYLAHVYLALQEDDKAKDCLNKCIEIDDMDYVSYNDLASIYEQEKNYNRALELLSKSILVCPNYFRSLYNLGVVYKALGDNQKALYYYNLAKEESSFAYIYLNMSAIYIEHKDYESAIDILTEGIFENNDSVNLFYNRACCYKNKNEIGLAISDLKKAISINSEAYDWALNDIDLIDVVKFIKE